MTHINLLWGLGTPKVFFFPPFVMGPQKFNFFLLLAHPKFILKRFDSPKIDILFFQVFLNCILQT